MRGYEKDLDLLFVPIEKKCTQLGLTLHKKYRSQFEIIAVVLDAMKTESAATFSIMKHAHINCMQLKKYLKSLTEVGLVEMQIKKGRVSYKASVEGLEFLRQYHVLLDMLSAPRMRSRLGAPYTNTSVNRVF
jgi:predicted transcriptional regulator